MKSSPLKRANRGVTLLEIVVGMMILTVGVLALAGTMGGISRSILVSKSQGLAINLAQEKIEALKNNSYYRLLVTTATDTPNEPELSSIVFDTGYYPPESLNVGQVNFMRGVLVQKVTESAGSLVANNWYDNDTGLKLVTVYVAWSEGGNWKFVTTKNLRDNPNRNKVESTLTGTIISVATLLQDVNVVLLENPLYKTVTDASGVYSMAVPAGIYQVKASKRGYFSNTSISTITAGATLTKNFALLAMGSGTVSGTAYLTSHLLISELCASVNGDDMVEYVELYNPTQSTFTMVSGSVPAYFIDYVRTSDGNLTRINPQGTMAYVNSVLYPNSYFLFSSAIMANTVAADAYYSDASEVASVPVNRFPLSESGGFKLVSNGVYESSGTIVDAIGWGRNGGSPYGPTGARENNGIHLSGGAGHDGFDNDEVLERMAYSTSTAVLMTGAHASAGNAFDSNANESDWIHHNDTTHDTPNNTSISEAPRSGTPAGYALVFVDDGLSSSAMASSTGYFTVTSVATGTWSILASSAGYVYSRESSVAVTHANWTNLGNVIINSSSTFGYAGGLVKDSAGNPLSSISINSSGGSDTTDVNGYYRMQLSVGTFTIVANQNNANSLYTVGETTGVVVNAGHSTQVSDIVLFQGGKLRGFVTTNGTDPLPGIPIVATNTVSGAEVGSSISDSNGYFEFPDLPVAYYNLTPQLETGESASPSVQIGTVTAGTTVFVGTFTVSNAFGSISGVVTKSGASIATGALIIAVPSGTTIGDNPPTINEDLRSGAIVYYSVTSGSDGTYNLPLRAGDYNLYGWNTTFNVDTASTTKVTTTATVTSGATTTKNLTW